MQHKTQDHNDSHDAPSFFDKPKNVNIILKSFYAICGLLVALDFVVHRHIYLSFEEIPAFYAIYGFVACVVLVVVAKLLRLVLMRKETYYDERLDELDDPKRNEAIPGSSLEQYKDMDDLGLRSGGKQ